MKHLKQISLSILAGLLFALPITAHAQDITTGLLGHWRLDETTGTTAADSSGNDNDGTFSGEAAVVSVNGAVDTALDFDGTDDVVTIPHSATLTPGTGDFTTSFWFKADDADSVEVLLGKREQGGIFNQWVVLQGSAQSNGSSNPSKKISFLLIELDGGSRWYAHTTNDVADGTWHHVVSVREGANTPKIYIDGQEAALTVTRNSGSHPQDINNTEDWKIGNANNPTGYGDSSIDDFRMYNRALTAADIAELHRSASGNMIFNTDNDTVQYFDDQEWIAAGPPKYKPNAVEFEGTTTALTSTMNGELGGTQITFSTWFRRNGLGTNQNLYASNVYGVMFNASNTMSLRFVSSTAGDTVAAGTSTAITDNNWHHIMFSFDTSDVNERAIYIDNVLDATTWSTYVISDTIDANSQKNIGARGGGTSRFFNGNMADFWMNDSYIDLSVPENRAAFIDAAGNPVDLGSDGSKPTGTAPDIFLSGDTIDWHTNKGTGGGFTENGALTSAPSPREDNYTWQQIGNNSAVFGIQNKSVAHLSNNEVVLYDDGGGTGTFQKYVFDGTNWATEGNSQSLNSGNNVHISALDNNTIVAGTNSSGVGIRTYRFDGTDWNTVGNPLLVDNSFVTALSTNEIAAGTTGAIRKYSWDGTDWTAVGNSFNFTTNLGRGHTTTLDADKIALTSEINIQTISFDGTNWSNVGNAYTFSGGARSGSATLDENTIVVGRNNSTIQAYRFNGTDWHPLGQELSYAAGQPGLGFLKNNTIALFNASNDRAVTFGFAYCTTPQKPQGSIIYESANDQMQYCDGENWVPMGPAGNGGISCSSPSGGAGDITYNQTYNLMQYCEGDAWVPIGRGIDPCDNSPSIGAICRDGSVYAGITPDGSVPMYVTSHDSPAAYPWNNGNSSGRVATSATDANSGETNTNTIVLIDSDSITGGNQPHQAAQYCYDLVTHGKDDWYLPAANELAALHNQTVAIGNFNTTRYWQSTEFDNNAAVTGSHSSANAMFMTGGFQKELSYRVRCFRK